MKIFVIVIIILAIVIICYILFFRKLYHSNSIVNGNLHIDANKLMIVAHPDDELIFGGKELLKEKGWKVICVTNGTNKSGNRFSFCTADSRKKEFISVMDTLGCAYEIWDFEDNGFNSNWDSKSMTEQLTKAINEKKYKMVVTHNLNGEYGHVQHKKLSLLVHKLKPYNLYVFGYVNNEILNNNPNLEPNEYFNKLDKILSLYSTQESIVKKYYTNILYQYISKVDF